MTRVLLDVNVVLDVLLAREPFVLHASALWSAAERGSIQALVPAHGVTTIDYLARRAGGAALARQVVRDTLAVFDVAAVDKAVLLAADALGWGDFEDAVCACAAAAAGCDLLVTRDPSGFPGSPVTALDPATAVAVIAQHRPAE